MGARATASLLALVLWSQLGVAGAAATADGRAVDLVARLYDVGPYERIMADCQTLDHTNGRNAAWGRWRIPLFQTDRAAPVPVGDAVQIRFRCRDGLRCIQTGRLDATPDRSSEHILAFNSRDAATRFETVLDAHLKACRVKAG